MAIKSDFKAAEEIKSILHGREKNEQERIMRWVSESIGIATVPTIAAQVTSPPASSTTLPSQPVVGGQRKDIKSFVTTKAPQSDVQFAAVVAYFHRFEAPQGERKEVIVPNDLQDAGRQARGFGFKKPLATLNNAVALGYFDRAGRGEFKLNAVGENLVAMVLPGTDSSGKQVARRKTKRSTKARSKRSKKPKAS
jgi:hypothetical protein